MFLQVSGIFSLFLGISWQFNETVAVFWIIFNNLKIIIKKVRENPQTKL